MKQSIRLPLFRSGQQTRWQRSRSRIGHAAATAVLAVTTCGLFAVPAAAATLSEQRAALRQVSYAAAQDYVDARPFINELARSKALVVKDAIAAGTLTLKEAGTQLTLATTQTAMDAASVRMKSEALKAATVRKTAANLSLLEDLRGIQQNVATGALSGLNAGSVTTSAYAATQARASAFSTHLAGDTIKQLGVIGKALPAVSMSSPGWLAALQNDAGSIPAVSGWVGFAGGCALPLAISAYQPKLPLTGPGIATNSKLLADAKLRVSADPALGSVHAQMLRSAASEAATALTLTQLRTAYAPRVARLGYGWLSGSDMKARDVLASEARQILAAGPEGMDTLDSSHLLLAAATATDWTKATGMEETALVRWLGPQTCLQADKENFVDAGTNIAAIHNSANFVAAAVFLKKWPAQAAALARESLESIQPALRSITTDGGTPEGPGYWTYQSRAVSMLYSTLPNVYVAAPVSMPSLSKVSNYALNSTGPDARPTPFADGQPEELSPLMPAWDAHVRGDSGVMAWVKARFTQKPDAYLMWWMTNAGTVPAKKSALFPQTGFAALHLPGSTATLKGGNNAANHSHLDLGTVSFFRSGVQWSVDPGGQTGSAPGYYSDATRWTYWKPGTSAHSTLMVKDMNQPTTAVAAVSSSSTSTAAVDLRQAFPGAIAASRSISHGSSSMLIKDVFRSDRATDLVWQWVTDATVSVGSDRAILRRSGQALTLRFTGMPAGSSLSAVAAPETGPGGSVLTLVKLSMPQVKSLSLTTTAY